MLIELNVRNFAIIDQLSIGFKSGFNVLSGETGAGKTVLLKSLALLMGAKSSSEIVRNGCEQATVEGLFDVSKRKDIEKALIDLGISEDEEQLIVRRVLTKNGKSKVYINGNLCSLQNLKDLVFPLIEITGQSVPLIEMTGQHDNRVLQEKSKQQLILDQFIGALKDRKEVFQLYDRIKKLTNRLDDLRQDETEFEQRIDFLTYQKKEIVDLNIQLNSDLLLEEELNILKNSQHLKDYFSSIDFELYQNEGSIITRLHNIKNMGEELCSVFPKLKEKILCVDQAQALLEDFVYEIRDLNQNVSDDPQKLEHLESRLSRLKKLQKKHGLELKDILIKLEDIEKELKELAHRDENLEELESQLEKWKKQYHEKANALHRKRSKGALLLQNSVNEELQELNMKGVLFNVSVVESITAGPTGMSQIEFLFQASKKSKALPLARVASGGELSRVLLSVKNVCGRGEQPRTYLFDEVDAGVSGETAEKVGKKLNSISKGQQVICVTHLPQVAKFADAHYLIAKHTKKDVVKMTVENLKKDHRVKEIARMISGEKITKSSLNHAKELLQIH